MRFWAYIPPHDTTLCPSDVPPKISLQTANMMMREGQYISAQSIKKSPQTQSYQGFTSHSVWCRWRGSNPHGLLAQRILSYLLHTEYRRTQPPVEVVDGHQKALPILLFLKLMCKKLRFVCHFRSFQFGRKFWILEGHRRDVTHKRSATAHAVDLSITNTL